MSAALRFRVAIPARYHSVRLPGKILLPLCGRPLIEHVYRQALQSGAEEVVIATDDERIRRVVEQFGARVCMTSPKHSSGTDRLAEVAEALAWPDDAIVVNLQGDEPLMPPNLLRQAAIGLAAHPDAGIATLCAPIEDVQEVFDPNVVKVTLDAAGDALYFSRAPIPYHRDSFSGDVTRLPPGIAYYRHIGLYAYRAAVLRRYTGLPKCSMEAVESLEQLRALWHGIRIHVEEAGEAPPPGVDTAADLARVERYLSSNNE